MSLSTRRDFLATTSLALAGTVVGRRLGAQRLSPEASRSSLSAADFLPTPMAALDLRALATSAVDAAKSAGATYADIRVAERHFMSVDAGMDPLNGNTELESKFLYGVRVLAAGRWAFVHGTIPTADTVAAAARSAVTTAQGYAKLAPSRADFAPAPAVTGEWTTPLQRDPFTVPLQEHVALLNAYAGAAGRVRGGGMGNRMIEWTRETRVFASTEGALTTQTLVQSVPKVGIIADRGMGLVQLLVPALAPASGGYERLTVPSIQDQIQTVTEEAVRWASLPRRSMDVGRYPVVFDGVSLGTTLLHTFGTGLELDRVLGYEANASGTSYLSPPNELVGTPVANPLLTVTGERSAPHVSAVRWDDEGVEAQSFPVITRGTLETYYGSRQTVPALRGGESDRAGRPGATPGLQGCAVASDASCPVVVRPPHLVIAPGQGTATLDDLCQGIAHGLVLCECRWVSMDQQLSSGSFPIVSLLLEIERGKVVRRVEGNVLQFTTAKLWKSLTTLGDAGTVRTNAVELVKGLPWRWFTQGATAPAALIKDVDVYSTRL